MILILLPLLVVAISMEFLIRNIPNDYKYKKEFLDANSDDIEVLFFGSSHTYYGVNPKYISGKAFNASHISQSIDYDYEILKKYKEKLKMLKYIVVPIDYFTLFSRVSTGGEAWRVKNYGIYYGIKKGYNINEYSEILTIKPSLNMQRIYSYYLNKKSPLTSSVLGYGINYKKQMDLEKTGKIAAKRHTKSDKKYFEKNKIILQKMIDIVKRKKVKVILYTSPAYRTYVSNTDTNQLKMTLQAIDIAVESNSNCEYYNFFEDSTFKASDFRDADHLNKFGAKKLSLKLNDILSDLNKNQTINCKQNHK